MNKVIRAGVKTKVLMLSATPVNNRFNDLRNQLALAYEGQSEALSKNLKTQASVEEIFRRAQKAFNEWSSLPPEERTAASILKALDFDFFELLDAVTIARSRRHIETFYDTTDIGKFPQGIKVLSLFFIDEVVKYRDYAAADEKGEYARVFEEEYELLKAEVSGGACDRQRGLPGHISRASIRPRPTTATSRSTRRPGRDT